MTVELPLVTGWLLPWDPLRLLKHKVLVLGSTLEWNREDATEQQTHNGVKGIESGACDVWGTYGKWSALSAVLQAMDRGAAHSSARGMHSLLRVLACIATTDEWL